MVLTLLTRAGCHLCEEMAEIVHIIGRDVPFQFEKVDVDGDPKLREQYGDQVPVLLIDGRRAFKYTLTEAALRRRLAAERRRERIRRLRRLVSRSD